MMPGGRRYGFSIGTGYPGEIWVEKMRENSRKMSNFARIWSRKIARSWESKNSKQIDSSGLDYDAQSDQKLVK